MQELTIDEIRKIQLDILKDFTEVCDKNNLRYSLCGGTLLGAIRHHGYIPWDDDIDIMMPRPDFENLILVYKSNNYTLFYINEKNYHFPFIKIGHNQSLTKGIGFKKIKIGVHIDILPIDAFPSVPQKIRRHQLRIRILRKLLIIRYYSPAITQSKLKIFFLTVCKHIDSLIPQKTIVRLLVKTCRKYSFNECSHAGNLVWGYYMKEYNPKHVFTALKPVYFENGRYMGSEDYNTYLSNLFGDYMQLPPEAERMTTHDVKFYNK